MKRKPQYFLCCILCTLLLGACATGVNKGGDKLATIKIEEVLAEASVASSAGQTDKSLAILKNATAIFPADKAPWLQMAQIKFDSANYGDAIVYAQEVLQRDQSDILATSIVAVSGLRLSTKALADLSRENNLSGSVRTEAQDLAKLLRESLGEVALVPVPPKGKAATVGQKSNGGIHKATVRAPQSKVVKGLGSESEGGNSNPFSVLK
jgi:hypothetical protein